MLDFLLLVFLIALMIALYGMLVSYRQRSRNDQQTYYDAESAEIEEG